ncbi:coenzyme F390 synthetase [soil metagenome]
MLAGMSITARYGLVDLFSRPFDQPLADDEFNRIALRVFGHQYEHNRPFAGFCDRRGRTPATVEHWTMIPAVPKAAFREVDLVVGAASDADAVFRTSGTTRGPEKRGVHHVPDVAIYHISLIPNFAACVLPDGAELTMLSLVPSSAELRDSSLARMIDVVMDRLGAADSACCATVAHGIDDDALADRLRGAELDGAPVCILGTSFAFVHWLDRLARRGEHFRLPPGSRLMDTGGYKGRSREVAEDDLRRLYHERLGIRPTYCVNEYGMTEMCSQFYDSTLRDDVHGVDRPRRKLVPPWVRTRVVDPQTLDPLEPGLRGLLQHVDLANAGSVLAIQTEDVGMLVDGGFLMYGRTAGATPRGCSIAMDLLLEAVQPQQP